MPEADAGRVVEILRAEPQAAVLARQAEMRRWARRLVYSAHPRAADGFNSEDDPDAFGMLMLHAAECARQGQGRQEARGGLPRGRRRSTSSARAPMCRLPDSQILNLSGAP